MTGLEGGLPDRVALLLPFKDVKHRAWEQCRDNLLAAIRHEILRHQATWLQAALAQDERQLLDSLAAGTGTSAQLKGALAVLSRALHLATGEEVVLLIDEYDTPIHEGWQHGYYDEVVELFRSLLSGGLKDNPHIYRGVLTGILRVAKESMFSGLNNVAVHTLLSNNFSRWFGFTEPEVEGLCVLAGPGADLDGIRAWYNGYRMGSHLIYNPWSVVSYLSALDNGLQPYWVNTASHDILRDLLIRGGPGLHEELASLIGGGEIVAPISENIQLRDLQRDATGIWSFLLFSGYLKARDVHHLGARTVATLSIPNREVVTSYQDVFLKWLDRGLGSSARVEALGRSLLSGDEPGFGAGLQRLVVESLSFFDTGGRTPEAVYQAFLVGLLVQLDHTHIVDANRESGFGRYDVCVRPRSPGPGAVLELKSLDPDTETPETALASAMKQIRDRAYATALRQGAADPVWLWAAVFDGKRVRVASPEGALLAQARSGRSNRAGHGSAELDPAEDLTSQRTRKQGRIVENDGATPGKQPVLARERQNWLAPQCTFRRPGDTPTHGHGCVGRAQQLDRWMLAGPATEERR